MKPEIENPFESISPTEIKALEERKKISLPDEYRTFLLQTNGGEPSLDVFEVPGWNGRSCVNILFGIHDGEYDNLEEYIEAMEGRLPSGFVAIGDDPGGNLLCIGTTGEYRGKIYFWDHENELDESGDSRMDMSNMYWLADSITEFLASLEPAE